VLPVKVLFAGQVPKDPQFPDANEDACAIAPERGRAAVSDGASESFDSRTWAHLLASRFIEDPAISGDWLTDVIHSYTSQFDPASLSWSKKAAFDRGSFATLLGIEHSAEHGTVDLFAIGDSLAVLLEGSDLVASFPYGQSGEFQRRPELLCTINQMNAFIGASDFRLKHQDTWTLHPDCDPVVLCMTDALGEWALRLAEEGRPQWETLMSVSDVSELEALVMRERQSRTMRVDDATLLRLSFTRGQQDELSES
jgi:hypothetical protein